MSRKLGVPFIIRRVGKMQKYSILRSYTVVEAHEVEAATEEEAIRIVDSNEIETHRKSYDGDYDKNPDGSIKYEVEGCTDVDLQ